ncbi:sigma-54-dependent Fis family transcriptional regulator [candidate division WOR-3 bacterium]|nr:sigma-54-dependent Fis family transcriptional regulator [candidate division WOR-3 bacterium]
MEKERILIVDDEEVIRHSLGDWLRESGYYVETAEDGYKGFQMIKNKEFDLALVDLKMPGIDGMELLKKSCKVRPQLPIVIITAYATVDSAVLAMKHGAVDYVMKPFNCVEISMIIEKILERQRLIKENVRLRKALAKRFQFQDIIGKSPAMAKVFEMIRMVAPTRSTVLITGESGTGKELVARAIHALSPRAEKPFIAAACGAMPETLLEAELFGYEKGAFTGATTSRVGRIQMADTGTLFLDEIGDISAKTQIDLLRFLQEREFRVIGGKTLIQVDIRIIAATNQDIELLVKKGDFREDLYYRLNVITINVPPLRERKGDVRLLVAHLLEQVLLDTGKQISGLSEDAMKAFIDFPWPGNVRQLENALEHAVIIAKSPEIAIGDLPEYLRPQSQVKNVEYGQLPLSDVEKQHIEQVLRFTKYNIKRSAKILGINRVTLYNKMKLYSIIRP